MRVLTVSELPRRSTYLGRPAGIVGLLVKFGLNAVSDIEGILKAAQQ